MEKLRARSKRTQITIFVIIAIVIIALLFLIFYSDIKKWTNPTIGDFIPRECMEDVLKEKIETTLLHGGKTNPELYFMYNNYSLNYLCYTGEWYRTCVTQIPLLKQEMEKEINSQVSGSIKNCIEGMKRNIQAKGYSLKTTGTGNVSISIMPKKVIWSIDLELGLEKDGGKQTISSSMLKTDIKSEAYDMIMIASSIQNFEARYGDSIPETYMTFYPNLRVEKLKQSDGTKVYIIMHRETKEKLQFATRSLAWPPGYASQREFEA